MNSAFFRYLPVLFLLVWVPAVALAQMCQCHLCQMLGGFPIHGSATGASGPGTAAYGDLNAVAASPYVTSTSSGSSGAAGSTSSSTQVVFLDFDSETSFTELDNDFGYTAFERQEILAMVEEDYEMFNFDFTLTRPASGDFSTITMNDGPAFGIAEQIDFRNIDRNDNATVIISPFVAPTDQSRITLTATVISHELGHILGLRHADAFGPIGSGINTSSFASAGFEFPGPSDATESFFHIMQTDPNNGVPFETFFGEREAVKLAFNEIGTLIEESASPKPFIDSAQPIDLVPLTVPNTLRVGEFAEIEDFMVDALTVTGSVDGGSDFFSFEANAGDLLYVEGISGILDPDVTGFGSERLSDSIASRVQVFDSNGGILDFFGDNAVNGSGPESIDAVLFDLLIPETGTYFVSIDGDGGGDSDSSPQSGDYELFLYTFGVDSGVRSTSAGDFNGDGTVDALDLVLFRESLGAEVTPGSGADGNANGVIDPEDYRYWLGNYGRVDAPATVPEPAAAGLLFAAALFGARGRRRG